MIHKYLTPKKITIFIVTTICLFIITGGLFTISILTKAKAAPNKVVNKIADSLSIESLSTSDIESQQIKIINLDSNLKTTSKNDVQTKAILLNKTELRLKADSNSKIIGTIEKQKFVDVLAQIGDWYYISNGTLSGYANKKSLTFDTKNTKIATITIDKLNFRKEPNLTAPIHKKLRIGDKVNVYSKNGKWCFITKDNLIGYVYTQYLDFTNKPITEKKSADEKSKIITITANILNVRKSPSLTSQTIGRINQNEKVSALIVQDEWVKINTSDGITGYIYKEYTSLEVKKSDDSSDTTNNNDNNTNDNTNDDTNNTSNDSLRTQIVNYAKQFEGNPYVYGGTSLTNGTDCSGFTQQVMNHFGIIIGRSSRDQYQNGISVSKSNLRPGDIVFYGYSSISHCALYIGNGQIIHAVNPSKGIRIQSVNLSLPYIGARNMLH